MAPPLGGLSGIAESAASQSLAFGLGFALGRALEPAGVGLSQEAWKLDPLRAPDAETMAEGVAQGQVDPGKAQEWATEQGYGTEAFAAMVDVANVGPALGYAYQAWRRGLLSEEEFATALKRTGLEAQWNAAMEGLHDELLDLGALATAVHRGIIAGQGLLLREPPQGAGKIPSVPQSNIDAIQEAAGHGVTQERLRVLIGNTGLPLALGEMLSLLNRGDADEDDVRRSIAQSNVRNEYMDAALLLRRRLLTPHEYEEAALRGVLPKAEADAGAALSGMEQADADLLFEIMGRPLAVHQITTGLARGGTYGGTYDDVPEPYRDAIRRSNIRPEYAVLAHANRYTYPSAFVLRALANAGELSAKETEAILLDIGWPPDLVAKVAPLWAGGGATAVDPDVKKAQTQLWNALHKSYVDDKTDRAMAETTLSKLGVATAAQTAILELWDAEAALVRKPLTQAQIKKAIGEVGRDTAWATAELLKLGMSAEDAATFLAE